MQKQRKTKNLGINRSRDNPKIYDYIENILGIRKKFCGRGKIKIKTRFSLAHKGKNPLPIREFHTQGIYINVNGKIVLTSKDGLQGACKKCDKEYRRARLELCNKKYSKMSDREIYENYKKEYGKLCRCSRCGQNKEPEDFPVSKRMERGLHNICKQCSRAYSESVGNRWIIYSPDGHEVLDIKKGDSCIICGSTESSHKDHIWPLSKGGTDNRENLQVLCKDCNLSKSASIIGIESTQDIDQKMICGRYQDLLKKAKKENWPLYKFELEISKRVKDFISLKKKMTNEELKKFFENEKKRNNRKHSIDRAVRKFRQYCDTAIIDINNYISKNL